jgi:hypothetical protein
VFKVLRRKRKRKRKRNEVVEGGKGCTMRTLQNLYSSPIKIRMMKSRRTRWAGRVA